MKKKDEKVGRGEKDEEEEGERCDEKDERGCRGKTVNKKMKEEVEEQM